MPRANASLLSPVAAAAIIVATGTLLAGPLNPPAGPITSTYKTLSEVEPRIEINATNTPGDADSLYRISQPGSYYLTGNVTGVALKHGIQITAHGVTLDLNGFELRGIAGSLDGVNVATSDGHNITVKNGSLRSWGDCGLEAEYNAGHPPTCTLTDLHAAVNTRDGIAVWSGGRIADCSAQENTGNGFSAVGDTTFTDCVAGFNGIHGFTTNSGCTLTGCIANGNTQRGIYTGLGSTVSHCAASNNATGFVAQSTIFTACSAYTNSGNGFDLFTGCTLTGCNAYRNAIGIDASSAATVTACSAVENTSIGINAGSGTTITGCGVVNNTGTGIQVSSNAIIRANSVINNGGTTATFSNIRATSSDNFIEGNNCSDAPIGIDIASGGNFIVRNTCSGNTLNWQVVAGNNCLVVLGTPAAAAISGDSGGASPGSTNPNANFTY